MVQNSAVNMKNMEIVMYSSNEQFKTPQENEDAATNEQQEDGKRAQNSFPPNSLLALLDDKNKSISMLKKQIDNQKLQLSFYLHKILSGSKIEKLSETCAPVVVEENIKLNLAMTHFCKQVGVKSRIMTLHKRMVTIERRILSLVYQQEDMVRFIVDKVLKVNSESTLENFNENSYTLTKILDFTIKLRKDIDMFRTCCNRLILIEDERNALVEQVYSMPITQRASCGVLLAAQYEKLRLEQEVQEIKRDQQIIQQRLNGLPAVCDESSYISVDGNLVNSNINKMNEVLEKMTQESNEVAFRANQQCMKYEEVIQHLRDANASLIAQNEALQYSIHEKQTSENELNKLLAELEKMKNDNISTIKEMSTRTKEAVYERDLYREKLEKYKDIEQQVKCLRIQLADMDVLRRQRDFFKLQVEDLQAVRAAYAQLVERCPPAVGRERFSMSEIEEQNNKIKEENVNLGEALELVATEANSLISKAQNHFEKYTDEIAQLKKQNKDLNGTIDTQQQIIQKKIQTEKDLRKWIAELQNDKNECVEVIDGIKSQMQLITEEKEILLTRINQYKDLNKQVIHLKEQLKGMEVLRKERDCLRMEVDDLQSIREAYLQLIDRYPPAHIEEIIRSKKELTLKFKELNKQYAIKCEEMTNLIALVKENELNIKHLRHKIEKARHRKRVFAVAAETSMTSCYAYPNRTFSHVKRIHMKPKKFSKTTSMHSFELRKVKNTELQSVFTNKNVTDTSSTYSEDNTPAFEAITRKRFISKASVEVQTINHCGFKTLLQSSSLVQEIIHVNRLPNSSNQKPMISENTLYDKTTNYNKICNLDENQLMKDASKESIMYNSHSASCGAGDIIQKSEKNVTNKLIDITSNLDSVLTQPGGHELLVNRVRCIYSKVLD